MGVAIRPRERIAEAIPVSPSAPSSRRRYLRWILFVFVCLLLYVASYWRLQHDAELQRETRMSNPAVFRAAVLFYRPIAVLHYSVFEKRWLHGHWEGRSALDTVEISDSGDVRLQLGAFKYNGPMTYHWDTRPDGLVYGGYGVNAVPLEAGGFASFVITRSDAQEGIAVSVMFAPTLASLRADDFAKFFTFQLRRSDPTE